MASILLKDKSGYGQSREGEDPWECRVFKGEFVVQMPYEEMRQIKGVTPNYRLYRDPEVVLYAEPVDVAPLEEIEIEYLQAVHPPSVRLKEYLNDVKMKMDLVVGDKVIFKLKLPEFFASKATTPTASVNGTIRYIGPHPDSNGIVFGIEIDARDQAYRGKGTSNGSPYFTCGPNNAAFVAMDKIIKKQGAPPTRSGQQLPEHPVMEQPIRSQTNPAARSYVQAKPGTASGQSKGVYDRLKYFVKEAVFSVEEGGSFEAENISGHKSKFKEGDRVILQTVKEHVVAGTVRWVGPVRVAKDMKVDPLPVVGIETDKKIDPLKDFDGANLNITGTHGTKFFTVANNHSQVFLPEQLVLTVDEFRLQKQKDQAAKFQQGQKETKQDDATEAEKRLAAEFGMTVAEYRRQQQRYVDAAKQGKDDRKVCVAGDPEIRGEEEKWAAGGGMIGGDRGRGEGLNDLTDTIHVMNVGVPRTVIKDRIEEEERALEEMKSKQQRQHEQQHGQHEDYQVIEGGIEESMVEDNFVNVSPYVSSYEQDIGRGRGDRVRRDELTNVIQAVQFSGPEGISKERVEKERRALEEIETQCLKEEIHQLQTSIENLQLEKDTQQRRAQQQEQQWRNEKQQLLEEQERLREEVKQVQEQLETDKERLREENGHLKYKNGQLKYENEDLKREIADLREVHRELQQETEKKEQVQAQLQSQVGLFSIENMRLKGQVKQLEESSATDIKYWEVSYKQVLTNKDTLGSGGWGKVEVGLLHGQKVAVKMLHSDIKSLYYNQLVRREISMLAKVRHPNLLLFIAGVLDHPSGSPIIITELLDTSLRKAYTDRLIGSDRVRISIMRDVAAALNYIHRQKESIIHRDVSSANVLLESRGEGNWKAKLSDFGSANLVQFSTTVGPGAIPYAAPEVPHNQTTKMDVYSYGVLLCEVMLSEFPFKERFPDMHQSLAGSWLLMYQLILSCTRHSVADRVDMMYVLDTFNEDFTDVSVKGFVPLV